MDIKEKKTDFSLLIFLNLALHDYYSHWIQ